MLSIELELLFSDLLLFFCGSSRLRRSGSGLGLGSGSGSGLGLGLDTEF